MMKREVADMPVAKRHESGQWEDEFANPEGMDVAEHLKKMIGRRTDKSLGQVLTEMAGTDD